MAELTRYQRSEAAQAVPTSKAAADYGFSLAERLRSFSNQQHNREDQQAQIEGKQAGLTAASGKLGGLDLSDNSTIRSRAFNAGAQLSHAAQIKIDINENVSRLNQKYQYNMEGFQTNAAAYKEGLLSKVDPTMRALAEADLNTAISTGTINIGEVLYKKERSEHVASIKKAITIGEELTLQLSANGDIEGADSQIDQIRAAIQEGINQNLPGIDQAYMDSYLAGLSELADKELIFGVFKRELEENGVDAAEAALKAFSEYQDPLINDNGDEVSILPATKRTIITGMETLINREKADQNALIAAENAEHNAKKKILKDEVTEHIKALDLNQFPETLEDLKKQLVGFPELQRDLARAEWEAANAKVFMTNTPIGMQYQIAELNKEKNLSPDKAQLLERMKAIYADTTSRMETDILDLAVEQGIISELSILDWTDGNAIKDRVLQYRTAQGHYGTSGGSPLTELESTELVKLMSDPETSAISKLNLLRVINEGFGDASSDLFEDLFDKAAPEYIMVGELINESTASGNVRLLNIGENILLGMEAIEKGIVDVDPDLKGIILNTLGNAAGENPDYTQMVIESAMALYVNEHKGNTDVTVDMEKEVEKYITQLTGGVLEINGTKIIAPKRGITEEMFEERLDGLRRNDLNAMGGVDLSRYTTAVALEEAKDGRFISVGQGKYVIVINEGPPAELLRNKHHETFEFTYDTLAGDKKTWHEDGFVVDYKKLDEEKAAADAAKVAAEEAAEEAAEKIKQEKYEEKAEQQLLESEERLKAGEMNESVSAIIQNIEDAKAKEDEARLLSQKLKEAKKKEKEAKKKAEADAKTAALLKRKAELEEHQKKLKAEIAKLAASEAKKEKEQEEKVRKKLAEAKAALEALKADEK